MKRKITAIIYGDSKDNEQVAKFASKLAKKLNTSVLLAHAKISHNTDIEDFAHFFKQNIKVDYQIWEDEFSYMIQSVSNPIRTKLLVTRLPDPPGIIQSKSFNLGKQIIELTRVPLLAVPGNETEIKLDNPKLLVADKLLNSDPQISDSFTFLEDLGGGVLLDAHIRTGLLEKVTKALRIKGIISSNNRVARMQIKKRAELKYQIKKKLDRIIRKQNGSVLEKKIIQKSLILDGNLVESIQDLLERSKSDFISVGQHRFFHSDNHSFGRLPIEQLASFKKPILVSP